MNFSGCSANLGAKRSIALLLPLVCVLSACLNMRPAPAASPGAAVQSRDAIAAIVASPDRSAADRGNDVRRKPEQTLAFIGVRPGMVALDLAAGGGYTSELLARALGPTGRVYGQSAPSASGAVPRRTFAQALAERASHPGVANLVPVVRQFEDPVPPEVASGRLDLVTIMFSYHDLGHMGVDRKLMNKAVFEALKPGGVYVIADHAGRPGTGISESATLHRIEEAFLRREVEAAGFKLVEEGIFLRNPSDPRDKNTPEPSQPKDEFVLKFVKP